MHVLKLPNTYEYIVLREIIRFRYSPSTKQYPGHRVFIEYGPENRHCFVLFKTKKTAQNFCAKLAKDLEKVLHHARGC